MKLDKIKKHWENLAIKYAEDLKSTTKTPTIKHLEINAIYNTINSEIEFLANEYIKHQVIPEKKFEDAMHISYATVYEFDILLSWNFKHLANIKNQMKINSFNILNGYNKNLYMLNPM